MELNGLKLLRSDGLLFCPVTPLDEISDVIKAAKSIAGDIPIVAGCGYGIKMATEPAWEMVSD